jgi:hypothetical protein
MLLQIFILLTDCDLFSIIVHGRLRILGRAVIVILATSSSIAKGDTSFVELDFAICSLGRR